MSRTRAMIQSEVATWSQRLLELEDELWTARRDARGFFGIFPSRRREVIRLTGLMDEANRKLDQLAKELKEARS